MFQNILRGAAKRFAKNLLKKNWLEDGLAQVFDPGDVESGLEELRESARKQARRAGAAADAFGLDETHNGHHGAHGSPHGDGHHCHHEHGGGPGGHPPRPEAPRVVDMGAAFVEIAWSPVQCLPPVTGYLVLLNGGVPLWTQASPFCRVENLEPGGVCTFEVVAQNMHGFGPTSPKTTVTTPSLEPGGAEDGDAAAAEWSEEEEMEEEDEEEASGAREQEEEGGEQGTGHVCWTGRRPGPAGGGEDPVLLELQCEAQPSGSPLSSTLRDGETVRVPAVVRRSCGSPAGGRPTRAGSGLLARICEGEGEGREEAEGDGGGGGRAEGPAPPNKLKPPAGRNRRGSVVRAVALAPGPEELCPLERPERAERCWERPVEAIRSDRAMLEACPVFRLEPQAQVSPGGGDGAGSGEPRLLRVVASRRPSRHPSASPPPEPRPPPPAPLSKGSDPPARVPSVSPRRGRCAARRPRPKRAPEASPALPCFPCLAARALLADPSAAAAAVRASDAAAACARSHSREPPLRRTASHPEGIASLGLGLGPSPWDWFASGLGPRPAPHLLLPPGAGDGRGLPAAAALGPGSGPKTAALAGGGGAPGRGVGTPRRPSH
eukprot:tig00000382_g24582.t1